MSQGAKLRSPRKKLKPTNSASSAETAEQLRPRLEAARLELRALYRSLDRMRLAQDLPAGLRRLQELDADFAEALWVLDQPRGRFQLSAMVDDTLASLSRLAPARAAFLASFDAAVLLAGVPAGMFGKEQAIEIGHYSGKSNVIYWLKKRGYEPTQELVALVLGAAKRGDHVLADTESVAVINRGAPSA